MFQCDVMYPPRQSVYWHAKEGIIYAWIVHRRELLDSVSWTSTTPDAAGF